MSTHRVPPELPEERAFSSHGAHDKAVCAHCGGDVDADGYASGGEVEKEEPTDERPKPEMNEDARRDMFVKALRSAS